MRKLARIAVASAVLALGGGAQATTMGAHHGGWHGHGGWDDHEWDDDDSAGASGGAATVGAGGGSFDVAFNGIVDCRCDDDVLPGLTASALFAVSPFSYDSETDRTTVAIDIMLHNTANAWKWESAVVTGIGFDTDPDALHEGSAEGVFGTLAFGKKLPGGAGFPVEICVANHSGFVCGGPGNTPLDVGESGTTHVELSFAGNLSEIDFTSFGIRWQALSSDKLHLCGDSGIGVATSVVPEPSLAALLAAGALGAALRRRRS